MERKNLILIKRPTSRCPDSLVFLLWMLLTHVLPAAEFVVPNDLENVEGDSASGVPFFIENAGWPSLRFQQIYDANQFSQANPDGSYITEIRFRDDSQSVGSGSMISSIQINLSATARPAGGLSTNFASNVGPDDTVVFGPAELTIVGECCGAAPGPFADTINLTSPYYYRPSAGNLLLDVRNYTGGIFRPFSLPSLDATTQKPSVSMIYANPVDATSGMRSPLGLVTLFQFFPVPQLTNRMSTNAVVVTWPTHPSVFVLQGAISLTAPDWRPITNGFTTGALYHTLTLPRESLGTRQFFRLAWDSGQPLGN